MIQLHPFLKLLASLIAGIIASRYFSILEWISLSILLIISSFMLAQVFRSSFMVSILYPLAFVTLGWTLGSSGRQVPSNDLPVDNDSLYVLTVKQVKKSSTGYQLELTFKDTNSHQKATGAILYLKDSISEPLPGDTILYRGKFDHISGPDLDYHFDRKKYFEQKNIFYQGFAGHGDVMIISSQNFSFSRFRQEFVEKVRKKLISLGFHMRDLEYLMAIGLGDKSQFDKKLKEAYQHLGLSHILAVSGLHVGIVWMIIFSIIQRIPIVNRLFLKYTLSILTLWFYVILSGAGPSVLRAGLMLSLYAFGKLLNRDSHNLNVIFAAAFLLLFFDSNLLYDLGFQLSFTAVISICWLMPYFSTFLRGQHFILRRVSELCLVSLVATLATSPITLSKFGLISNVFLLSNLIFLPAVAFELYSFIALLLVSGSELLMSWLAKCLGIYLEYKHQLLISFASIEHVSSRIKINDMAFIYMIYLLFILLALVFIRKSYRLIKYVLIVLLTISLYSWKGESGYVVRVSESGKQWIEYRKGEELIVIADTSSKYNEYHTQQLLSNWSKTKVLKPGETYVGVEMAFVRGTLICADSLVFTDDRLRKSYYSVP